MSKRFTYPVNPDGFDHPVRKDGISAYAIRVDDEIKYRVFIVYTPSKNPD